MLPVAAHNPNAETCSAKLCGESAGPVEAKNMRFLCPSVHHAHFAECSDRPGESGLPGIFELIDDDCPILSHRVNLCRPGQPPRADQTGG